MRVLLIGGTGFVSGRVLRFALANKHTVIAITRGKSSLQEAKRLTHIIADRDVDDLIKHCSGFEFDVVIDAICKTESHAKQSVNLARKCRRVIMVSSEYAYDPDSRLLEMRENEAVFSIRNDYGGDKYRAEKIFLEGKGKNLVDATILRPAHIYGPGSLPGTIPKHGRSSKLLDDIQNGRTLHLLHGGLGLIQPIHADDFARIVLKILDKRESYRQDYNCVGPELMTHLLYYQTLAKVLHKELKVIPYCPKNDSKNVSDYVKNHRYYSAEKLNLLLPNFKYTPFEDGMRAWVKHLSD